MSDKNDRQGWVQLRVRLPRELHEEIESEALAIGSTVQREIHMLILKARRGATAPAVSADEAQIRGELVGEIEVAKKMLASAEAVLESMQIKAGRGE